jgi:hypothetical protein
MQEFRKFDTLFASTLAERKAHDKQNVYAQRSPTAAATRPSRRKAQLAYFVRPLPHPFRYQGIEANPLHLIALSLLREDCIESPAMSWSFTDLVEE